MRLVGRDGGRRPRLRRRRRTPSPARPPRSARFPRRGRARRRGSRSGRRSRFEHSSNSGRLRISSTLVSARSSTAGTLLMASRLGRMSQTLALPRALELPGGGRLPRVGAVDAVALEARAGELAKRSIKRESKVFALELAIRMMDLTTLEGADTPGKVRAMSAKAMHPDPGDPSVPSVAAVCVYPSLVVGRAPSAARERREGRLGRDRVPVRPGAARRQARGRPRGGGGRSGRDRHGDRSRRVPLRPRRSRVRGGRRGQGGVRRRAPEGDPRDGRARHVRRRAQGVARRDRRRRGLHQDLDRQGHPRRRRSP